jgi:hypothetical protein
MSGSPSGLPASSLRADRRRSATLGAALLVRDLGSKDHFDKAIGLGRDDASFVAAIHSGRLKSAVSPDRLETMLR